MKVCKWCREEIVEGSKDWIVIGGNWMHKSGLYTCPRHPETIAEPADERWESVFASVGVPEYDITEPKSDEYYKTIVVFLIEVVYNDRRYYTKHFAPKEDLEEFCNDGLYAFLLDKMVQQLDFHIEEWERRPIDGTTSSL